MHVPGREGTRKWLNAGRLATMKRGAIVVNTARGALVDDEALIAGLKSGHIRAAGLDVYDGEPKMNPGYLTLENVTLLPHLGSHHRDARCHGAPGSGEPGCGAAEGHHGTGSGGLNEQGPAACGGRP